MTQHFKPWKLVATRVVTIYLFRYVMSDFNTHHIAVISISPPFDSIISVHVVWGTHSDLFLSGRSDKEEYIYVVLTFSVSLAFR